MTKTTILVAGTGSIGQRHARLLAEREDVELWLCDSSRACLDEARKHASCTRVYEDYDEALEARGTTNRLADDPVNTNFEAVPHDMLDFGRDGRTVRL